jgi:hypothetical protein
VRVGPALFIVLDSNQPLGPGSAGLAFLEAALVERQDARFVFVTAHQGPLTSGPHGGYDHAQATLELLDRAQVTAFISGHDHIYERLRRSRTTFLVSGGGGAPLYFRATAQPASEAFGATYHWVKLELDGARATIESRSLEGVLLDQAQIAPPGPPVELPRSSPWFARAGLGLVFAALLFALARLVRA